MVIFMRLLDAEQEGVGLTFALSEDREQVKTPFVIEYFWGKVTWISSVVRYDKAAFLSIMIIYWTGLESKEGSSIWRGDVTIKVSRGISNWLQQEEVALRLSF